jgi:hypothetical protein
VARTKSASLSSFIRTMLLKELSRRAFVPPPLWKWLFRTVLWSFSSCAGRLSGLRSNAFIGVKSDGIFIRIWIYCLVLIDPPPNRLAQLSAKQSQGHPLNHRICFFSNGPCCSVQSQWIQRLFYESMRGFRVFLVELWFSILVPQNLISRRK